MKEQKTRDIIFIQSVTTIVLFIVLPYFVEKNWLAWVEQPVLYIIASFLLIIISILGNLAIRKLGYYHYILLMIMTFLLYRNLPTYITNFYEIIKPEHNLPALIPLSESKAVPTLIIPFLLVTIVALTHSMVLLAIDKRKIKQEKLIAELMLLKSQINPHFFFNSLNSIYHLALTKDDKAPGAIITLSDMMRYVLTDAKEEWVVLEKEIDYINKYIDLQKQRIPHCTKVNYKVDVDDMTILIAPLLLISFVENAFKYGISSNYDTEIQLALTVRNGQLTFVVRNQCYTNAQHIYGTASGIDNVRKRLEGMYDKRHKLYIYENGKEFLVELYIDLTNNNKGNNG